MQNAFIAIYSCNRPFSLIHTQHYGRHTHAKHFYICSHSIWILYLPTRPFSFSLFLCLLLVSKIVVWLLFTLKFCRQTLSSISFQAYYGSMTVILYHTRSNVFQNEKKKNERRKNNEQTTQIGNFVVVVAAAVYSVCWAALYRWWFLCKLAKWVSWSRYILACSLAPSLTRFLLRFLVSNSFSCVWFRSSLLYFSSWISFLAYKHPKRVAKNVCTHRTIYMCKMFSYLLTITSSTTTATETTNYSQKNYIFYELFF